MIGRGGDKAARQDMFPTRVAEWQTEARVGSPPIGTGSSFDLVSHPVSEHLRALGALRDAHPALSTGASFVRRAQDGVLAVSRIDREARREYLAVFNASEEPASVTIQTATPGTTWAQLLGPETPAATGANGRMTLRIPPLSALLYRADSELPRRGRPRLTLRAAPDRFTNLLRLTATSTTPDPLGVCVRRAAGGSEGWAPRRSRRRRPVPGLPRPAGLQAGGEGLARGRRALQRRDGLDVARAHDPAARMT